jgi:hypothetical protein
MNIDTLIVEEPTNYETIQAIEDVKKKKGTRVKDSGELFSQLKIRPHKLYIKVIGSTFKKRLAFNLEFF